MLHTQKQNSNKIFLSGFVLILIIIIWSLARPAILRLREKKDDSEAKINAEIIRAPLITSKDLFSKIQQKEKIFLLDLRSSGEFSQGHLATSLNVAADSLAKEKLQALGAESTSEIVVLNQGNDVLETARKTNELTAAGFKNAKYLQGGISAWMSESFTLVSSGAAPIDKNKIKMITVDELIADLSGGQNIVQFVDSRDAANFKDGHIPGAINMPLTEIEKDQSKISPVRKIVVYGANQQEAEQTAVTLFDFNFFNVYVLEGGLDAWRAAGGKVEQ